MGRPKKLREDESVVVAEKPVVQEKKNVRFKPYVGAVELPPATFDKRGRLMKAGESRYFLRRVSYGYKLIRKYRNGFGTGTKLAARLKMTARGKAKLQANALLKELKACGIRLPEEY